MIYVLFIKVSAHLETNKSSSTSNWLCVWQWFRLALLIQRLSGVMARLLPSETMMMDNVKSTEHIHLEPVRPRGAHPQYERCCTRKKCRAQMLSQEELQGAGTPEPKFGVICSRCIDATKYKQIKVSTVSRVNCSECRNVTPRN